MTTQPTLFPEAPAPPAPVRCTVDTSGVRDRIVPCRTMAWMLDADKRCFRMTDCMIQKHSDRTRDAVVIDLVDTRKRTVFSWCDFCPFCGASLTTRFRDNPPTKDTP